MLHSCNLCYSQDTKHTSTKCYTVTVQQWWGNGRRHFDVFVAVVFATVQYKEHTVTNHPAVMKKWQVPTSSWWPFWHIRCSCLCHSQGTKSTVTNHYTVIIQQWQRSGRCLPVVDGHFDVFAAVVRGDAAVFVTELGLQPCGTGNAEGHVSCPQSLLLHLLDADQTCNTHTHTFTHIYACTHTYIHKYAKEVKHILSTKIGHRLWVYHFKSYGSGGQTGLHLVGPDRLTPHREDWLTPCGTRPVHTS